MMPSTGVSGTTPNSHQTHFFVRNATLHQIATVAIPPAIPRGIEMRGAHRATAPAAIAKRTNQLITGAENRNDGSMQPNVRAHARAREVVSRSLPLLARNLPPILLTPGWSCQLPLVRRWRHVVQRRV